MKELKTYEILVSLTVRGEDEDDAIDYAYSAIDMSDILDQDGIVGVNLVEDSITEDSSDDDTDYDESEED